MSENPRIDELEMRLTFQEQALVDVSDALAATRAELARQSEMLRRVVEELKSGPGAGVAADPADEPPPPHY